MKKSRSLFVICFMCTLMLLLFACNAYAEQEPITDTYEGKMNVHNPVTRETFSWKMTIVLSGIHDDSDIRAEYFKDAFDAHIRENIWINNNKANEMRGCRITNITLQHPMPMSFKKESEALFSSPEIDSSIESHLFDTGEVLIEIEHSGSHAILPLKPDKSFGSLEFRMKKAAARSITMQWKAMKDAKKYIVYGNRYGAGKYIKIKTTKKNSLKCTKIKKAHLKSGTFYKFKVVAIDKDNNKIGISKPIYVSTSGGKGWNYKSVKVSDKVISKAKKLKIGKTLKFNAKAVKSKANKAKAYRPIAYESSDPSIAAVSAKGVVKAKMPGTCYVYAYAQNGVFKKVKVTVLSVL